MREQLSVKLASFLLREEVIKDYEIEIYEYGIQKLQSLFYLLFIIGFMAILIEKEIETIFFVIGVGPLRAIAGGYHAESKLRCNLISMCVYLGNIFMNTLLIEYNGLISFLVMLLILIGTLVNFGPVEHRNHPFAEGEFEYRMRMSQLLIFFITCIAVFSAFIIGVNTMVIALIQGLLTGTTSAMIANKLERRYYHERN